MERKVKAVEDIEAELGEDTVKDFQKDSDSRGGEKYRPKERKGTPGPRAAKWKRQIGQSTDTTFNPAPQIKE